MRICSEEIRCTGQQRVFLPAAATASVQPNHGKFHGEESGSESRWPWRAGPQEGVNQSKRSKSKLVKGDRRCGKASWKRVKLILVSLALV